MSTEAEKMDYTDFIDEQKALEQMGSKEMLQQMMYMCVPMTFDPPEGLIYEIKQAYDVKDYPNLKRLAHSLKGRSLNLLLTKLYDLSKNLQDAAKDGKETDINIHYKALFDYLPVCQNQMLTYSDKEKCHYPKIFFEKTDKSDIIDISQQSKYLKPLVDGRDKQYNIFVNQSKKQNVDIPFDQDIKCSIF